MLLEGMMDLIIIIIIIIIIYVCCRFAINLQCGPKTSPRDDIALHVAPRFNASYITRNSLQNMVWGAEENHGYMPLACGQGFEIIILCDPSHYKVSMKRN